MTEVALNHGTRPRVHPRRPLRVCHLAYTFYETDNRVTRYARALVERGDEVDVIALRRAGQRRQGCERGVCVIRLQRRAKTEGTPWIYLLKILSFMVRSLFVLSARHLYRRYDIVHVHNVPDFLVFAALLPKLTGAGIILDIHDVLPELYAGKFGASQKSAVFQSLLLVERLSCRFADRVVVANHIWHERLVQRAAPPHKCLTILNCPDLRMFRPRPRKASRGDGRFIILYPGTLSRHQGLDVAIRAFAAIADRMPDAEFHIYGEGPARSELMHLTHDLGVDGRVILREPLPVDQIAEVIASADVGVEPKQDRGFANEALSTKVLEFMASGVPVILSRTLVHAHYFDDRLVTFFAPNDHRELAAALVKLYTERPDASSIQRAREFAAGYGWQTRVTDYYSLIKELSPVGPLHGAEVRQEVG
jgi:glycosyltransferase involved in cell wall biosynthesis